jgi:hypothetical protein
VVGTDRHEEVMNLIEDLSSEIGTAIVRDGSDGIIQLEKPDGRDTRTWVRDRAMSYPRLGRLLVTPPAAEPVLSA